MRHLLLIILAIISVEPARAQGKPASYQLTFEGKVSKLVYVQINGSTTQYTVLFFNGEKPFSTSQGWCFLSGISHDMDKRNLKGNRVYKNHRSPFMYLVFFSLKTHQWGVTARGGAPGSWAAVRCIKY